MIINRVRKITNYRFLNLFSARYADRQNNEKEWIFVSRSDQDNPLEDTSENPDAVLIVPYHTAKRKLVLIREFRVVLNGYQYGFPAGLVDKGETVEQAGARELLEETGLTVSRILTTGPAAYSSSGLTDESVSLLFVECQGEASAQYNEASEDIETLFLSQKEAKKILNDPTFKFDIKTWIILKHFAATGMV